MLLTVILLLTPSQEISVPLLPTNSIVSVVPLAGTKFNNDNPRQNTIYLAIRNYGVQTQNQVISVTLTLLKIGE